MALAWKGSDQFQQFNGRRMEPQIPDLPLVCPTKIRAAVEQGKREKPGGRGDVGL